MMFSKLITGSCYTHQIITTQIGTLIHGELMYFNIRVSFRVEETNK